MFENDASVDAEIAMSKEALDKVEREASAVGAQESKEWAKFASVACKIDHAMPESHWKTLYYAKVSDDGEESKENNYMTIVLETERFQVVRRALVPLEYDGHSGQDEVLVLLKRDPIVLGKLFRKILPRLPLLVVKVSYEWERMNSDLGAYVSYVNYDYNSEYQELYQLLQRELAERLKQKTYDTQVNTSGDRIAVFRLVRDQKIAGSIQGVSYGTIECGSSYCSKRIRTG